MKIGILQTGDAPAELTEFGTYPDMFEQLLAGRGFTFARWRVNGMEFPDAVTDCDGWLITGSRHGVYEDHPFIAPLEQFIRDAFAAKIPVAGICFGHQIMAQALGGKVKKFAGGWSVGQTEYDFGGETLRLNAWHQDQVVEKPDTATVIASSPFCRYAALAYGDLGYSVQAHPEYGDGFIEGLIDTRGKGVVPDDLMTQARAKFGGKTASDRIADQLARFFTAAHDARARAAS